MKKQAEIAKFMAKKSSTQWWQHTQGKNGLKYHLPILAQTWQLATEQMLKWKAQFIFPPKITHRKDGTVLYF